MKRSYNISFYHTNFCFCPTTIVNDQMDEYFYLPQNIIED
jgi:hypothetical protein